MDPKKVNKKQTNVEKVITRVKNWSPDMILTPFGRNLMRKKMSYLLVPVDLKKAEKKQWVKVSPQTVEKQQTMSTKWVFKKLKKNNVDKEGVYIATY